MSEARWLSKISGRIGFEVATTFVPVAGVAGKISKGTKAAELSVDAARGTEVLTDAGRVAGKVSTVIDDVTRLSKLINDTRLSGKFDDLIRIGSLTRDELTLLAKAGKFSASDISNVVSQLGVKTPRD